MEERVVKVNQFVGPSYTNGLFGFRFNQQIVPYSLGNHYGTIYHLNMGMIEMLADEFPDYIKAFNKKVDKGSEWGPQTEIGLCMLMMDGKLKCIRKEENGKDILVHFIWDGPIWEPNNRPTKRK